MEQNPYEAPKEAAKKSAAFNDLSAYVRWALILLFFLIGVAAIGLIEKLIGGFDYRP